MSTPTTDPMLHIDDRARDPLLKTMLSAGDLFGGMLAAPAHAHPDIATHHPTKGICRVCGKRMSRSYIAFVGNWTPLRECDGCANSGVRYRPQPIKQTTTSHHDRTEPKAA